MIEPQIITAPLAPAGPPEDDEVYLFPASFAQQRLWFLDQFEPNSPFYNIPTAVRLSGQLNLSALERCLGAIVARHESLRTTFAAVEGQPVQLVAPSLDLALPLLDLSALPSDEREARALEMAGDEARRPFDLACGPLLRVVLIRLAATEHILLLTMHHIISDGWSMGVLVGEVATLYGAFVRGEPAPLPDLPIQYGDFAEWQREQIQGELLESQIAYWRTQLSSAPALDLPTDRPRPVVQSSRGALVTRLLPAALARELHELSRREGATLFMTLLAGFQALLHRYSGQEDFCVGTPIAGRARPETEGLIGCFINTLALRADLGGAPSLRELLRRVRATTVGAFANQDAPFEMLVDALQIERDMSRSPLFQVMFILQNAAAAQDQALPGLTLSQIETHSGTSTSDLTLMAAETADGLELSLEYCSELFSAATAARMLGHLARLLAAALAEPDQPLTTLPMLGADELAELRAWNPAPLPLAASACLHELIAAAAARDPAAIAVAGGAERLSYGELDRRANQLAHHLRARGAGPERIIGIALERSPELLVALLAVLKAGAAFLPLDLAQPAERRAAILADARPLAVIARTPQAERLPVETPLVLLDAEAAAIAGQPAHPPASGVAPHHLAYLIYTSGSTGRPKGVLVEHRSLLSILDAWTQSYDLARVRRHLQMASFGFDVFIGDVARALGSGATLVLCPRETLLEPARLAALLRAERIECAEFVPAVLRGLAQHLEAADERLEDMRLLICGSDAWSCGEYARLRALCAPTTRLINSYGLTETTIDSTYFELAPAQPLPGLPEQPLPIGRPFANTTLDILDAHGQPVPVGVPGELYIGGHGLARGYHGDPALTAARFLADPAAGRRYRTGDRARYRPDGTVEYLGRADQQLKLRGIRIEPGEVEAALSEHPGLRAAAVAAHPAPGGEPRLVAYTVAAPGAAPTAEELRRYARERLPEVMLPARFVALATLPLLPSGKLDRRALPAPDWADREDEAAFVAPRTPEEQALAGIWAQLLGLARVGAHDDFFALGGHSLLATQLVARLSATLGVSLPLRVIFEAPRLEDLAARLAEARQPAAAAQPIPLAPRGGPLPLSFAQQRLWFLDQLEPGSPLYNIPETMRLRGPLDVRTLARCLNELARRHESLRTRFITAADGQPRQLIAPELRLELPLEDLRHLPPAEREPAALQLASEEAARPFDLAAGPLLRARLLRLADDDHLLLLTIHHIIGDDWSTNVLIGETSALYDAFAHGRPAPLPALPIQYADYAAWQRARLQGAALERELTYWRAQLRGSPPLLELPTDRPRPAVPSHEGAFRAFSLPRRLAYALRVLSQREGATLYMALLAAFAALLSRYSGQEDLCVGSPIAGRERPETEDLVGLFVNTLVLRADLSGTPSFRQLLARVRATTLDAYAHQELPFEMVVDALRPERSLSHSPLFQVMFAMQNTPGRGLAPSELALSSVPVHSGTAKFDLTLFMTEAGDELGGALEYRSELFDDATITRMLDHFRRLIEAAVADPDQPVIMLPMLSPAERRQLLVEWNDTAAPFPEQLGTHALVAAQAVRTPDAIAVRQAGQSLSYAALEARANRLAALLQRRGVGPDQLVALCLERSPAMLIALLATLKAGGAYLPLDPSYPAERLEFMLADARPRLLITTRALLADRSLASPAAAAAVELLLLDDAPIHADTPYPAPPCAAGPDNLAYVIYTSGSTGRPKGALITHRGLTNYLTWAIGAYPAAAGRGAPVHSSLSFDLTVTSLFTPLLTGGCVDLLPDEDLMALGAALRQPGGYSLVKITPAHLELLGQQLAPEDLAASAQALIIGGENLRVETLALWQAHAPQTLLVNEYGPTETVVGCCVYALRPGERCAGIVPIGRPIANTRLYVLDPQGQPVPIGVVGELYIGGAGVARGYLNRPALTAERFLPDPFVAEPGARMYRSGDLARYRPDGVLECLGRTDHQVKIRGFRIELGEIEAALAQAAAVREAAVLAREDRPGQRALAAYVVPVDPPADPAALAVELRAWLQARLPEHMVPAAIVPLAALPLTPNGKLDRDALPAPADAVPSGDPAAAAPRTPAEATLAAIWAQLLGRERVGRDDNFFALGGDSILSIQVVARAAQVGLRLTPRHIFEAPTLAALAALAGSGPQVEAEQGQLSGPLPLTPIQHWFFEQALPVPQHWNQSLLLETRIPLQRATLEASVAMLCAHHDALRLRFARDGAVWQASIVPAEPAPPVVWVELAEQPDSALPAAMAAQAAQLQASLDLSSGPLLRIAYFDLGPGRTGRLLLIFHHLCVDGVSWRVLLEDLPAVYAQIQRGDPPQLPPKTSSYRRWAERLRAYAADPGAHSELEAWRERVAHAGARLPRDFPAGLNSERTSASVAVALGVDETARLLHEAPAAARVTLNALLLTALARALAAWVGAAPLLVDLEGHGRAELFDDIDLSRTVGWFTSLTPLPLDLRAAATPGTALEAVSAQLRQLPPLGPGPLRYLSPDPALRAAIAELPAAEIAFNYLGQLDQALPADGPFGPAPEESGPERDLDGARPHVIDINGSVAGGRLSLEWTYSTALHRHATIERVAAAFIAELRLLIEHCLGTGAAPITPADLAEFGWGDNELTAILAEINRTQGA